MIYGAIESQQHGTQTLADWARIKAEQSPHEIATYLDSGDGELAAVSYAEIWTDALQLATALAGLGCQFGDVVSFQLPNWRESVAIDIAASLLGLVVNPIIPIYRERELQFIIGDSLSKVLFIPAVYRGFDFVAMAEALCVRHTDLQVVVVGDKQAYRAARFRSYATLLADAARQPLPVLPAVTADDAKIVMYTSGTTGKPKAVIHSHASIACALYNGADSWKLGPRDRMLMPSPVTHVTGYVNGIELPFFTDTKTILMQQWEVARAVELIESYGATACISATPFLQELVERCRDHGKTLPGFRLFACGGAAVPPTLIEQAGRVLSDCRAFRVYGSTEVPLVTVGFSEAEEGWLAANTDGKIYNYEVKVVDECGRLQPLECDGELMVRGPAQMVGYKCVEQNQDALDLEGFFATGDIGHVTPAGAIVVTDRKKDIIIRGGENLSAREIEELLLLHPTIVAAAAVAFPHQRLGEGVCACLVLAEGSPALDVESLKPHLAAVGLAKQKWPEKVVLMSDFPMTASGKVRKDQLRKQLLLT